MINTATDIVATRSSRFVATRDRDPRTDQSTFRSVAPAVVSVINTATNTEVATIPVNNPHVGVRMNGLTTYVINNGWETVKVIDNATNTVISTVHIGRNGFGVATSAGASKAYDKRRRADGHRHHHESRDSPLEFPLNDDVAFT